jgi:homoserine dehydrogenase
MFHFPAGSSSGKTVKDRLSYNISLVLVSRSKSMIYTVDYSSLDMNNYEQEVATSKQEMLSLAKVVEYLAAAPGHAILVDILARKRSPTITRISSPEE